MEGFMIVWLLWVFGILAKLDFDIFCGKYDRALRKYEESNELKDFIELRRLYGRY